MPTERAACLEHLGRLLPQVDPAQALAVLHTRLREDDGSLVQDTHGHLAGALRSLGVPAAKAQVLAIRVASCEPAAGVMVGNSETNDIQPAVARGLRAVRAAIEEPVPASSAAHAVVTSLEAVAHVVRRWATDEAGGSV